MSDDLVQLAPQQQGLYLVGFRLDPRFEGAQFYTLVSLAGESEQPLTAEGRILFFRNFADASRALALADPAFPKTLALEAEVEMLCDLAQSLYVVSSKDVDDDGVLLDCIACLDDLLRAVTVSVPTQYGKLLAGLSTQLDQSPEFGSWLKIQEISRDTLEDALMWCIGAVAVKSSWV